MALCNICHEQPATAGCRRCAACQAAVMRDWRASGPHEPRPRGQGKPTLTGHGGADSVWMNAGDTVRIVLCHDRTILVRVGKGMLAGGYTYPTGASMTALVGKPLEEQEAALMRAGCHRLGQSDKKKAAYQRAYRRHVAKRKAGHPWD